MHVTGDDAASYLHGQFSNQLKRQGEHPVVYGFWLSLKGKVDADSYVLKQAENDYLLISFGCSEEALLNKLSKNIIADDVTLQGVADRYRAWVFWGNDLDAYASANALRYPPKAEGSRVNDGWLFESKLLRSRNLVWIMPKNASVSLTADAIHTPIEIARIAESVPFVPQDIGPEDLPQEGGLDAVGVSVQKGCYLGQVVMMRIHSMGNVKRGLFSVRLTGPIPPLPSDLYLGEKNVGALRSVATVDGVQQGIALLKKHAVEKGVVLSLSPGKDANVIVLNSVDPI